MLSPASLPTAWRDRADELEPYAGAAAEAFRRAADELEAALREQADEELTLAQAAEESGYSKRRLRELIADGVVPQAGRKHAPRVRRADLPVKPGSNGKSTSSAYDAATDAAELAAELR